VPSIDRLRELEVWMVNRIAAVCLVFGVMVGYLVAGASVRAQSVPTTGAPVSVFGGDDVLLEFESGTYQSGRTSSVRCRVVAMEGNWIKCGSSDGFGVDRTQKWMNLAYVVQVTKTEK
jgi:hypothetical protein